MECPLESYFEQDCLLEWQDRQFLLDFQWALGYNLQQQWWLVPDDDDDGQSRLELLDTVEIQWMGWHRLHMTRGCLGISEKEPDPDKMKSEQRPHSTTGLQFHQQSNSFLELVLWRLWRLEDCTGIRSLSKVRPLCWQFLLGWYKMSFSYFCDLSLDWQTLESH